VASPSVAACTARTALEARLRRIRLAPACPATSRRRSPRRRPRGRSATRRAPPDLAAWRAASQTRAKSGADVGLDGPSPMTTFPGRGPMAEPTPKDNAGLTPSQLKALRARLEEARAEALGSLKKAEAVAQ